MTDATTGNSDNGGLGKARSEGPCAEVAGRFFKVAALALVASIPVAGHAAGEEPPAELEEAVSGTVTAKEAATLAETLPAFIFGGFHASNRGDVLGVYSASTADLVLLRGGYDAGFRNGMVCVVEDQEETVAEMLLVDVRHNCAAALITNLEDGQVIEAGHQVRIKAVR